MDQGLLAEMEMLSSAEGRVTIAWGRAGWGNCEGYPYQDSRDQGQVLRDEAHHTSGILSIFALKEESPEQNFRDFFAHGTGEASAVARKGNFGTQQPGKVNFGTQLSQGEWHQESCHTP